VIRTCPIRVAGNSGPLPQETSWENLSQKAGKELREYTTVTNKLRRVAAFDIDIVRKAVAVNRPTQIALQFLNYVFPEDENKNTWDTLDKEARAYIGTMEKNLGVPITLIGTGVGNGAMIDRR
jgi:adenylosuccinate synthase